MYIDLLKVDLTRVDDDNNAVERKYDITYLIQ